MQQSKVICTVTNDLAQDNRMKRICNTFYSMGFDVMLVGRNKNTSTALAYESFSQVRLNCIFERGFLFYLEYNVRLIFFLLKQVNKSSLIYTVDSDTLLAGGIIKMIKKCKQIFDAHEYFTKVPELSNKPIVRLIWSTIENVFVPKADIHITVGGALAKVLSKRFGVHFSTIYNVPLLKEEDKVHIEKHDNIITYVGMLNKGRGLEQMIEAMKYIKNAQLWLVGDGDLADELKLLATQSTCSDNIIFMGWKSNDDIQLLLSQATIGINLLDSRSESYYYSLANKFFDYVHAELPSVNMKFPEYQHIIDKFEVGILIDDLSIEKISASINNLLKDKTKLHNMRAQCQIAKHEYHWDREADKIKSLFNFHD